MNAAEKLITIANNTPAVAEAVNSAKATASGKAIRVDDVLNVKHSLKVQLKSKNLVDIVSILGEDYVNEANGLSCRIENGYAVITGTHTAAGYTNILLSNRLNNTDSNINIILPAGTYSLASRLTFQLYNPTTGKNTNYGGTFTITEPHRLALIYAAYNKEGTVVDAKIPLIIVEGDVIPTEYTPYTTDFTDCEALVYGKNLCDLSSIIGKTTTANGGTLTIGTDGGVTGSGTPTGSVSFYGIPIVIPKGNLTFSASGTFANMSAVIYLVDAEGTRLGTFAVQDKVRKVNLNLDDYPTFHRSTLDVKRKNNNDEMTGTMYVQLELGDVATEYEPYKEPQTATADASGKVTGLVSVSPSMTLVADDAVTLECTYFPESAAGVVAKYQGLKQEQTNLQDKLQIYKEG